MANLAMSTDGCRHIRREWTALPDGRRVAIWTLDGAMGVASAPIVIGSGFGRRMDDFSAMALYLWRAGFTVVRYDGVDQLGMSEGDIAGYTLSTGMQSLKAVVDWACRTYGVACVGVVATSLTARLAYRLAARSDLVAFVVSIVGVVDVRATLAKVFGQDYGAVPVEALPATVTFERQTVGSVAFYADFHDAGWGGVKECASELSRIGRPVVAFIADQDAWVDHGDVRRTFADAGGGKRLIRISGVGHNVGGNPAVGREFLRRIVEVCKELAPGLPDGPAMEPTHSELMQVALAERRAQRAWLKQAMESEREVGCVYHDREPAGPAPA